MSFKILNLVKQSYLKRRYKRRYSEIIRKARDYYAICHSLLKFYIVTLSVTIIFMFYNKCFTISLMFYNKCIAYCYSVTRVF